MKSHHWGIGFAGPLRFADHSRISINKISPLQILHVFATKLRINKV
jgi:hypothetical protein